MNQSEFTADPDEIERWGDEHDAVPIREADHIRLVPEDELESTHERIDWDTFHREVGEDRVVVRHAEPSGRERFEVADRSAVLDRMTIEEEDDRTEIEERLIAGETLTGTITETTVIEETIVEETTLESEVVDREVVEREVVDVELLDRTCESCDIVGGAPGEEIDRWYEADRFLIDDTAATEQTESYDEYPYAITVQINEDWSVTIEEFERYTVETRAVDAHVSEADTVGSRDRQVDTDIDIDAVHDQLFRGDMVDLGVEEGEVVDTETYDVSSEFTADDTVTTHLTSRRTIDREVSERRQLQAEVVEGELLSREVRNESVRERGLAASDMATAREETGVTDIAEDSDETLRRIPEGRDVGKPVVVASGDQIGMVTEVKENVAYVDPHPGITEKITAKLGWGGIDEEDFPIGQDRIEQITSDEVRLAGEYDEEDLEDIEVPD